MTDRELLELAAKAAGIEIHWALLGDTYHAWLPTEVMWNPLNDDGDALRLAVKLEIKVMPFEDDACAKTRGNPWLCEPNDPNRYAATRRAIVRAAASIGRRMK